MCIDREGNAYPGAGTTIYRNVTAEVPKYPMKHLKIRDVDHWMTLAVYDGGATIFKTTWEGVSLEAEHVTMEIKRVDDVVKIGRHRFIVVGDKKFLPLTVDVNRVDNKIVVKILFGKPYTMQNDDDEWPHIDNLTNTTFAVVYENGNDLWTRIGTWKGEGAGASLEVSDPISATSRLSFHGVAGMDDKHFIVAATGNHTEQGWSVVTACLCTIGDDGKVTIGDWVDLPWSSSHNFFDMDNMGRSRVILVFSSFTDGSIHSVVLNFNREKNTISWGAQRTIQRGGAVLTWNRIDIRVLNEDSFAVFYEDNAIQSLVLVTCALTWSNDIAITSPPYIISRPWGPERNVDFYYDLIDHGSMDFMIGEYRTNRWGGMAMFHRGVVLPRMFGIAQKANKGKLTVQFAGTFKVPGSKKFTPGRSIYTNSRGDLIEGRPFGYATRNFGTFYEEDRPTNSILSNKNIIGLAVTKKKIFMKFV